MDHSLSEGFLFTDFYELVMAQLYYKLGYHEKHLRFEHFFRNYPDYGVHQAGYCISAGLEWFIKRMQETRVTDRDTEFLRLHKSNTGKRVFHDDFLSWLKKNGNFESLTINAIPEGRVVHPFEPLTVVEGPSIPAQIIETALLNQINFQTLIATKAARIKESTGGGLLIEFGARRAQEKAAFAGVRGALIGGADFTSNSGISYELGFPPKGTHAHSLVQMFLALGMTELDAFDTFADLYPDDCILLVDTIDTLGSGVPNAIKIFEKLKKNGHRPVGVRLDSGDLAYLTVQTAKMLNDAGFNETGIVLSNDLDELTIWQILSQIRNESSEYGLDADEIIKRLIYGVGTKLITSSGEPALGGVYKLTAVKDSGKWIPSLKISENIEKMSNPGKKQVWRIYDPENIATADLIALEDENPLIQEELSLIHPANKSKRRNLKKDDYSSIEPLLKEIIKEGKAVVEFPSIDNIRKTCRDDQARLHPGVKRLINPHVYHVSITPKLWEEKEKLYTELRHKTMTGA